MNDIDRICHEHSAWQVPAKFTPPTSDQIRCPGCDGQNNDYRLDYEAGSMEFNVYECLECGQRFTVRIK